MQYTSATANKLLKKITAERDALLKREQKLSIFQIDPQDRPALIDRGGAQTCYALATRDEYTAHHASWYAHVMARSAHDKGNTFGVASWGTRPHTHHDMRVVMAQAANGNSNQRRAADPARVVVGLRSAG